jgi:Flp pilus assembly protein TadD
MIYDRLGDIGRASLYYLKSVERGEDGPCYLKALTNYTVTLEKLGKRDEAQALMEGKMKRQFGSEIRLHNNLGILHKRNGNSEEAEASYLAAL